MSKTKTRISAAIAVAFAGLAISAGAAQAELAFEPGSVVAQSASSQAGAHADFHTSFKISTDGNGNLSGAPKTIITDMPAGFLGNPTATPRCTAIQVANRENPLGPCPSNTAVGSVTFVIGNGFGEPEPPYTMLLYNVVPYVNEPAAFMFQALLFPIRLDTVVRSDGNYNVEVSTDNISEGAPLYATDITLWGVPADHQGPGPLSTLYGESYGGPLPGQTRKPFLSNPSVCDGNPLLTTYGAIPWVPQANPVASVTAESPTQTGCDKEVFAPGAQVRPTKQQAGTASAYEISLTVPQAKGADGLATPPVKDVSMEFPPGMTISPSVAGGLGACSDAQIALKSREPEQCPDSSKIGTVKLVTPLLETPLEGSVYQGTQASNDPQSGKMYRLFLVVAGSGVRVKLEGELKVDPSSGQLTATFDDNPQLPFETLELQLMGGSRAPLVTPATCGTYATTAKLTSWAQPNDPVIVSPTFTINQGCDRHTRFTPQLEAGTTNPVGGSFSPFTLRVTQEEGQQNISTIGAALPTGLLAKLAGVPLCSDAQAATGDCPGSSQVGSATVGAGAGADPLYVPQAGKAATGVYLAGPYQGGPYSLVVKVPAQAGPFDLGTVAVRNALYVDPVTTQVTVKSDPLPQILGGVPLDYRDIRINIDRPDFTVNPTSCEPKSILATIASAQGTNANVSGPFQAVNCEELGMAPKLALKFSGAPTRRGGHPKLTATLTTRSGDANLRQVQVTLPKTEYLENAHIRTVCTRVQYAADQCPQKSIYGYARAWTPLLDQPLEGPVYLRSSSNKLPDLVASLDGKIHVDLDGRISSFKRRIRNTFETVPDAPVTKFVLTMQGGGKGLLVNNTNLCKAKPRATVEFDGQNGKLSETNPLVQVGGCGKGGKKKVKGK